MKRERVMIGGMIFSALLMAVMLVSLPQRSSQAQMVNSGDGYSMLTSGTDLYISDGSTMLIYRLNGNMNRGAGMTLLGAKNLGKWTAPATGGGGGVGRGY